MCCSWCAGYPGKGPRPKGSLSPIPPVFPTDFMTFCICLNCASSVFTSCTVRPAPLAIRSRRCPLIRSGLDRSFGRHREHDRLDVLELLVVDLGRLQHRRVHPRQHAEHVLERPHLLHLPHGAEEVLEVQPLLRGDLLRQPLGFLLVDRALRLLHQREDVALLEDPPRQPVGMERLQRVELLAHADVLDRRVGDAVDGERRAAAGVAVHLGEDHAGDAEGVVEALGDPDRVLAGHAVGDEQDLVRAAPRP